MSCCFLFYVLCVGVQIMAFWSFSETWFRLNCKKDSGIVQALSLGVILNSFTVRSIECQQHLQLGTTQVQHLTVLTSLRQE